MPPVLDRVWTIDNQREQVLWEMGQQGGVSGDCFVKIAYEEPHMQPPLSVDEETQQPYKIPGIEYTFVPGKVRILVINSAFVFPEWYPHDRSRLMRVKTKYRFWGTTPDGMRQVFMYTEIMTDTAIEEYINDEIIDSRPNPLGEIPMVHIPNVFVSGSPWGLADIADVVPLNRLYNEVMTDIVDIVNYHASPVTVVIGAKANQLEKGAKKIWAIPNKDASISNLELGENLQGPLEVLDRIKSSMHELTGVHATALGQEQAISNTSGVALAIQFQPLMNRWHQKTVTYGAGIRRINYFVLRTLALKEPEVFQWDPTLGTELKDGQPAVLDLTDPTTFHTETHFPPPLPIDIVIKLNEIQAKMALGLESKRGALKDLGIEFPDAKMQEIFQELLQDAEDQAALDMLKAQLTAAVAALTGIMPMGDGSMEPVPPQPAQTQPGQPGKSASVAPSSSGSVPSQGTGLLPGLQQGEQKKLMDALVARAYGTKMAQWRNPENNGSND